MATYVRGAKVSTRWHKYEPANMPHGGTNHWAIMKQKATTFSAYVPHSPSVNNELPEQTDRYQIMPDGSVVPLSGEPLDAKLRREISDNSYGTWNMSNLHRSKSIPNMKKYRNEFNDRAKDGFRFWYQPRPKPTQFGKYGMGGYKTVLGLGDAVRS